MPNLDDICLTRSNDLTRQLAGCVAIDPLFTLPLIDRLQVSALTDLEARRYILAMRVREPDFYGLDIDGQIELAREIACKNNLYLQYCGWVTRVNGARRTAAEAIRLLQALSITLNTIEELGEWNKTCEELSEWR
jgi:hypothetical protein